VWFGEIIPKNPLFEPQNRGHGILPFERAKCHDPYQTLLLKKKTGRLSTGSEKFESW